MRFAMLPSVLLPWSPYAAASGNSPTPTLSITITIARWNGPPNRGSETAALLV
jgi:hypothetical protein